LEWPHWRQTITSCPFDLSRWPGLAWPDGKSPGSPWCWTSVQWRVDCRP
jgi:hypothetical protein